MRSDFGEADWVFGESLEYTLDFAKFKSELGDFWPFSETIFVDSWPFSFFNSFCGEDTSDVSDVSDREFVSDIDLNLNEYSESFCDDSFENLVGDNDSICLEGMENLISFSMNGLDMDDNQQ